MRGFFVFRKGFLFALLKFNGCYCGEVWMSLTVISNLCRNSGKNKIKEE